MIGPLINSAGIVVGGVCALAMKKPVPNRFQLATKIALGVYTVWFGLQMTWKSLSGTMGQVLKQLCIVLLAMALGKLAGRALRLQNFSNSIGRHAARSMSDESRRKNFSEGFLVATALFCIGPLAVLASVQEGLAGFSPLFLVKAGIDGLATMAFCLTFGWGALVSAIPVLGFQGALVRSVQWLEPKFHNQPFPLVDSIYATDGLLIFCVAMIILEVKKIRVAEYLPSLVLAPLLTRWLW